jgi:hypothetical protein
VKNLSRDLLKTLTTKLIGLYKIQKGDFGYYDNFDYWQKNGFHIIPNHYYQPIPDTSTLKAEDFGKKDLVGIRMDDKEQLEILDKIKDFKSEFTQFKKFSGSVNTQKDPNFYFDNLAFDTTDALLYYGMVRLIKPRKIIEIGSGWSTKIAAAACLKNGETKLDSIEPYPQPILKNGFPGFSKLIEKKVEDVSLRFFESLRGGDILFIDSSHVSRIGGDVNHIFFEILPRLRKGVYVHIHDIFLPYDYPKDWVMKQRRFWSEQYILHAFLLFNDTFEIVYAKGYMNEKYPSKVKKVFPAFPPFGGGSMWIRKVK